MEDRTKIVERVRNLMAKADPERNNSEHEVLECLGAAKRLIEKYNVEEFEWNQAQEKAPEWEFTSARSTEGRYVQNWLKCLGVGVALVSQTECITTYDGDDRCLHFYGDKIDVRIALALFKSLSAHGRHLAEQKYTGKTDRNSYLLGFADGVQKKAREDAKKTQEERDKYALVSLEKKGWLAKRQEEAYPNRRTETHRPDRLNPWAMRDGEQDGRNASTTYRDKLTTGAT